MKSRSLFGFDLALFAATIGLTFVGVLFVFSSGVSSTGVVVSTEYIKQIVWASMGLGILFALVFANYNRIGEFSLYIYIAFVALLVLTLFFGQVVSGGRRWFRILGFGFQASEFAKIATILYLASYFDRTAAKPASLGRFVVGMGFAGIPMVLVLLQPDMGTAFVYMPIFLFMAFVSKCRLRYIAFVAGCGLLLVFFGVLPAWQTHIAEREIGVISVLANRTHGVYAMLALSVIGALGLVGFLSLKRKYFYWIGYAASMVGGAVAGSYVMRAVLRGYQMTRLIVFLDPTIDPRGAGWNVIQSVTAVGSGGLVGKGWLKGTQSHYRYLPQQSTDFIFSIIAEEWGFVGSALILLLFALVLFRGLMIMTHARDRYGALVSAGIVGMMFSHAAINIGMVMGVMPITGIPLFFLSYGGSALWTGLIGVGLLLNIHFRRYRY